MTKELDNMTGEEIFEAADRLSHIKAVSELHTLFTRAAEFIDSARERTIEDLEILECIKNNPENKSIPTLESSRTAWCAVLRMKDVLKRIVEIADNYGLK